MASVEKICLLIRFLRISCDGNGLRVSQARPAANLMPEKRTIFILSVLLHFYAVADMIQRQLLPQAILALAQRLDTPPNRGDMLTEAEVEAFHK